MPMSLLGGYYQVTTEVAPGAGTKFSATLNPDGSYTPDVNATIEMPDVATETTLLAFKNANHTDLLGVHTRLASAIAFLTSLDGHIDVNLSTRLSEATFGLFATQNHTDLTLLDTDLLAFKSDNHTDLLDRKSTRLNSSHIP